MENILIPSYQEARLFSDYFSRHQNSRKIKKFTLSQSEFEKLNNYSIADVSTLSVENIREFQMLYTKQCIYSGIIKGDFSISLEFSCDLHDDIKIWLKENGYFLKPYKNVDYSKGWMEEFRNPAPESKRNFSLLW